jgi:hypothetical protein
VQQPVSGQAVGQPTSHPPQNYLVWSILSTLLCWPLGIFSIVFAAQVNGKYNSGDIAGALASSKKAKQFAIAAAIVGGIAIVIYVIAAAAVSSSDNSAQFFIGSPRI